MSAPGFDADAFRRWYDDVRPGELAGPVTAAVIAGGKSNLTYRVTDGATTFVVRRPPLGHVQATAHDMAREHTVMAALADSDVPVPRMSARCDDADVMGAPFYVMEDVAGTAYRSAAQLAPLGAAATAGLARAMVEVLARLHAVSPGEVGLDGLGRPTGFLERQVRRWGRQLEGSATRPLPDAEALLARLAAAVPAGDADRDLATAGIVHGDYRLDNLMCVVDPRHSEQPGQPVRAVVDWEMATLGDPLTDVALLLVYDDLPRSTGGGALVADASTAPGYPDRDAQLAAYVAAGGRDVGDLGFHLGLAYLKIAVILEGIHHRHLAGQTVGDGFDRVGDAVEPLLAAGLTASG